MPRDEIYLKLAELGCIMTGEFRLSSGRISPYYINLRKIISYPAIFDEITNDYVEIIKTLGEFDRVAGVATAGIPIATIVAYKLKKPLIYVRKEKKTHGTESEIEGELEPGNSVILVDDVATTGESLLKAALSIKEKGGILRYAVVFVDREEGAEQNLKKEGITLVSLSKVSEIFSRLYLLGSMERENYELVMRYLEERRCSKTEM